MRVYFLKFKAYRGLIIYLINVKILQRPVGLGPWNPQRSYVLDPTRGHKTGPKPENVWYEYS